MNPIDHAEQAGSRIYAQYRDKPKTVAWIEINGKLANEIETAYQDIAESYNIDDAGTYELDVLGRIVVISRSFEGVIEFSSSQFGRSQFGRSQFQPSKGVTDQELNNDTYRILIKSKVARNINDATLDGIINSLSIIVATDNISIVDNEDMSFNIIFDALTSLEKIILSNFDIIPKPQGVDIASITDESSVSQFGRSQFGRSQFAYTFGG